MTTDPSAEPECDGCDQDPWTKPVHYGTCPLTPKVPDALYAGAEAAYDREDQEWFNNQSTEDLVAMWALCCNIHTCPSWDDEVYDALHARGHWDVRPCAYTASTNHSDDRVQVHHGRPEPTILCGYHATPEWLPTVLEHLNRQGSISKEATP